MDREKNLDGQSFDNVHERIEELKRMFPEAVSEGRLDYDAFMALLGDEFDNDHEKYRFEWKGKLDSLKLAQKRSAGTLRPDFDESRDWETTGNLYIEGDNLEVLKLLQQGYLRKVKMIYIDPPYNTGNDFVYEDDFADPIAKYKEATGQGMRANPETAGRYHSKWLSMMYPRLRIAKTLLRDDGVIFISCDDVEQANIRKLCDEVFGEENFVEQIIWQKRTSPDARKTISAGHEYILMYIRNSYYFNDALSLLTLSEKDKETYKNPDNDSRGPWVSSDFTAQGYRPNQMYKIVTPGGAEYTPAEGRCWKNVESVFLQQVAEGRMWFGTDGKGVPRRKTYLSERSGKNIWTWWPNSEVGHTQEATLEVKGLFGKEAPIFDYPKPSRLIKRMVSIATNSDDIILDFFSGSGTTAHAVMQLNAEDGGNRKFIMVQIPEPTAPDSEAYKAGYRSIADIGRERIRRAGDKIKKELQDRQPEQLSLGTIREYKMTEEGMVDAEKEIKLDPIQLPSDIGFRVFKLDSSNLKKWDDSYVTPDQLDLLYARMEQSLDGFKDGRRSIDVVYEVFLKYGVPLTEKLATLDIGGKNFYVVGGDGYLFICLDAGITVEIVEEAAQYAPGTIIFSDECFENDDELTNAGLVLEKANIEFRWI